MPTLTFRRCVTLLVAVWIDTVVPFPAENSGAVSLGRSSALHVVEARAKRGILRSYFSDARRKRRLQPAVPACEDAVSFVYKTGTLMQCAVHVQRAPASMCKRMAKSDQKIRALCPVACGTCTPERNVTTAPPATAATLTSDSDRFERTDLDRLFLWPTGRHTGPTNTTEHHTFEPCQDTNNFKARAKNKMVGCGTIRNEYTRSKYCDILVNFQEEQRQIKTYCPAACEYPCQTHSPTRRRTALPTERPTALFSHGPSVTPSVEPSDVPARAPVVRPSSSAPTLRPTARPTLARRPLDDTAVEGRARSRAAEPLVDRRASSLSTVVVLVLVGGVVTVLGLYGLVRWGRGQKCWRRLQATATYQFEHDASSSANWDDGESQMESFYIRYIRNGHTGRFEGAVTPSLPSPLR